MLDGYKTYIAGIGLIALGVYQLSLGQIEPALQSIMGGLTALGLRHAISKNQA